MHFLSYNLNKPIFHKNLKCFFFKHLDTYVSNTLLLNDYKNMGHLVPFSWNHLIIIVKVAIICYRLFFLTWNFVIILDMVELLLYRRILLIGLEVVLIMILGSIKCYTNVVVIGVMCHIVQCKNENDKENVTCLLLLQFVISFN